MVPLLISLRLRCANNVLITCTPPLPKQGGERRSTAELKYSTFTHRVSGYMAFLLRSHWKHDLICTDCLYKHWSQRNYEPGNPQPVCSELEKVVSGWRLVSAVSLNVRLIKPKDIHTREHPHIWGIFPLMVSYLVEQARLINDSWDRRDRLCDALIIALSSQCRECAGLLTFFQSKDKMSRVNRKSSIC